MVKSTRNFVELFSGSGVLSRCFSEAGFKVFSVDVRRRKGVCEPDLKKDVMLLSVHDIPFNHVDVLWASIPCEIWSYAAGSTHWKNGFPASKKCIDHLGILFRTLALIDDMGPTVFFIENPRGRLRDFKPFRRWLFGRDGCIKIMTLSSYGFPNTKPTNLFTNAWDYEPKPLDPYGRGAKVLRSLDSISRCQKQKTPVELGKELVRYCLGELQCKQKRIKHFGGT